MIAPLACFIGQFFGVRSLSLSSQNVNWPIGMINALAFPKRCEPTNTNLRDSETQYKMGYTNQEQGLLDSDQYV